MISARYLHYLVHGEWPARRSPRKARRGPARSWKYKAWIRSLPSAVSGRPGCQAAHTGDDGGMSMKSSDYSCIPLTAEEHMEFDAGREAFCGKHGLDVRGVVRRLNHDWFAYRRLVK